MNDLHEQELTNRELAVLDYVKAHPRCSKVEVANYMTSPEADELGYHAARPTVWDILDKLEEQKIILVFDDEKNRQTKRLVLNQETVVNEVLDQLRSFERAFFRLVNQLKYVLRRQPPVKIGSEEHKEIMNLIDSVFEVFYSMVETMQYQSRVVWPMTVHDPEQLENLCASAFVRIADMQTRLFKEWIEFDPQRKYFLFYEMLHEQQMMFKPIVLDKDNRELWSKYSLSKETNNALDIVKNTHLKPVINKTIEFEQWREKYLIEHPEVASKLIEEATSEKYIKFGD